MPPFTHIDTCGNARMVDVSEKASTNRRAIATGAVFMTHETLVAIRDNTAEKGNVIETARIAGIMAAKKTSQLIPLCHPLSITHAAIDFVIDAEKSAIHITSEVKINAGTGVEMEALTALSVAALTIYDMCKSYDKNMRISDICLQEKTGGKSGHFQRNS